MDYGMIGKIEKAKRYAQERERIQIQSLQANFTGENNAHRIHFESGEWKCDCHFFMSRGLCSHTMALERILEGMLPAPVQAA